jgi:hypothetical protein
MYYEGSMRRVLPFTVILLLGGTAALAQVTSSSCPTITVSGGKVVTYGSPIKFTAEMSGVNVPDQPTYHWTVSSGTIAGGQGKRSMIVDTTGLRGASNITASVEVKEVPVTCASKASDTGSVGQVLQGDPVDTYGKIRWIEETARLDGFLYSLSQSKDSELVVVMEIPIDTSIRQARTHAKKIAGYVRRRDKGFDLSRLSFIVDIDQPRTMTSGWIVPNGAKSPTCSSSCIRIPASDLVNK